VPYLIEGVLTHDASHPGRYAVQVGDALFPLHAGDPLALWDGSTWWPGRVEWAGAEWLWIGRIGRDECRIPLRDGMRVRERR